MDKRLVTLILCLLALPAHARYELYIGAGTQQLTLIEKDRETGQQLVQEQGWMPSAIYGLYLPIDRLRINAHVQQSFGFMPYDGQTQTGVPHQSETTHYITQGNASFGFMLAQLTEVYTGLNIQEDVRNVANRNNVYGATEVYDEVMLRYGIKQTFFENHHQRLWAWGEWQNTLYALSNIDQRANYDDLQITLKKGSAYAFGLRYQQELTRQQAWFIESSYYVHQYKDSSEQRLTSNGQVTSRYAYQPPIEFTHISIYGGLVWTFD
jgi:hypothetical protein